MDGRTSIAQPDYQMFERNIAHLARRAKEVRVRIVDSISPSRDADGRDPDGRLYTGFLAGIDEGYLQLCRTDNQCLVLIDRDFIVEVEATGRVLWRLQAESEDPVAVKHLIEQCEHFIRATRAACHADA